MILTIYRSLNDKNGEKQAVLRFGIFRNYQGSCLYIPENRDEKLERYRELVAECYDWTRCKCDSENRAIVSHVCIALQNCVTRSSDSLANKIEQLFMFRMVQQNHTIRRNTITRDHNIVLLETLNFRPFNLSSSRCHTWWREQVHIHIDKFK